MTITDAAPARRKVTFCSTVSEESGEDPAGSAWAVRRMLITELPLPWPENVLEAPNAPEGLSDFLMEWWQQPVEPWGILGVVPDPDYSAPGMVRISDYQQPPGVSARYRRASYLVTPDEVMPTLRRLAYEQDHPALDACREPDDQITRDLYICTHGAVDACCATFGVPIYQLLKAMAAQATTPTRVWRCTHFGGHRFAATAFDLPQGHYWGRLKPDMLAGLIHRNRPASDLRPHYRGSAAVAEPLQQLAEAEMLSTAGWRWLDATITGLSGDVTENVGGTLSIDFVHPEEGPGRVDLTIVPTGVVKSMGSSKDQELFDSPQYRATIVAQNPPDILDRLSGYAVSR